MDHEEGSFVPVSKEDFQDFKTRTKSCQYPAVIHVNASVASGEEPPGNQRVGLCLVEMLRDAVLWVCCAIDITTEEFPAHPTHRRCPGKIVASIYSVDKQ